MELLQSALNSAEGMDVGILLFIQEHLRCAPLDAFFSIITHLGDSGAVWIALCIILLFFKKTRRAGALALVSMALGAVITNVFLKSQIARIRPYDAYEGIVRLIGPQLDYSFPSGHTTASFCSCFIYAKTLRRPFGALTAALAVLISFSRLYVGVHYPTDVLGGILVGALVSTVLLILFGSGSYGGESFSREGKRGSKRKRGR